MKLGDLNLQQPDGRRLGLLLERDDVEDPERLVVDCADAPEAV